MSMKIIHLSHLDHNLTEGQKKYIFDRFADRTGFFIETFELPTDLGTVPCALIGPTMGDDSVSSDMPETYETSGLDIPNPDLIFAKRGTRNYPSRVLLGTSSRPTRTVTVIAGPNGDDPCVLYTAFGGPLAPREPGDPSIKTDGEQAESKLFWAEHALAEDILTEDDVARYERESAELLQNLKPGMSGADLHKIIFGT